MNIEPLGFITSCYKEKFGIPRQPGLVPLARADLLLNEPYSHVDMIRGLEAFSHVWLLFGFHGVTEQGWKRLVRPPRMGGNDRIGVFASRSMFRPNGLGLSVCKLDSIVSTLAGSKGAGSIVLKLSGVDLLDKTPVFDIKPYLPYVDAVPTAHAAYAIQRPQQVHDVVFSELAQQQCQSAKEQLDGIDIMALISQILAQDPRPAYHSNKMGARQYGMKLYHLDIKWRYELPVKKNAMTVVKVLSLC